MLVDEVWRRTGRSMTRALDGGSPHVGRRTRRLALARDGDAHRGHLRPSRTARWDWLSCRVEASANRLLATSARCGHVYTAFLLAAPHRPAYDPRTALTETLMAAGGLLDRNLAERLLSLSFTRRPVWNSPTAPSVWSPLAHGPRAARPAGPSSPCSPTPGKLLPRRGTPTSPSARAAITPPTSATAAFAAAAISELV